MANLPNRILRHFGWAQDLRFSGALPGDEARVFFIRRHKTMAPVYRFELVPIEGDGTLRVRIDGDDTGKMEPGFYQFGIIFQRGEGSALIDGLPDVEIRDPLVTPGVANDPLLDGTSAPLSLRISRPDLDLSVALVAGLAGRDGRGVEQLDSMVDLSLIFENGLI